MSKKETGGPAFPATADHTDEGMTLRDYFAAKAMQACLWGRSDNGRFWTNKDAANYAGDFYVIADAMLAERNKP